MSSRTLRACMRFSVGRSLTQCRRHACLTQAPACASAWVCMPACAGAVTPRSAVANPTSRATGESPPPRRSFVPFLLHRGECRCAHSGRACAAVGGSIPHAVSPPRVFGVVGGVCVCLFACVPACAGAVTPRSAVVNPTSRAASESPPMAPNRIAVYFASGLDCVFVVMRGDLCMRTCVRVHVRA
jgi:hypothetical protein